MKPLNMMHYKVFLTHYNASNIPYNQFLYTLFLLKPHCFF